jgi:hypothetical protein
MLILTCTCVLIHLSFFINNVNIHSTGTNINAVNNRRIRGVYVINSGTTTVVCNYAYNVGQCFTFEGPQCNGSRWELNRMFSAGDGFVVRNNGVIGAQGNITDPVECRWMGGFIFSQTFVENTSNINTTSPLYVNVGPFTNPTNNTEFPNQGGFYVPIVTNIVTNKTCPFPQGGPPPNFADNGNRNALVQDSIPFVVNVPESRYTGKQSVLADLFQDSSLMQNSNLLQQFFTSSLGNNYGKIHQVEQLLGQGNLNGASAVNNGILDTSVIESNHKVFSGTFISTLGLTDSLTQNQLNDITLIANQCPELGGGAVLKARSFLNWYYQANLEHSDSCTTNTRISEWMPGTGENVSASIYPNPNNGTMTLSYMLPENAEAVFEIHDLTGRVVSTHHLRGEENELLISESGFAGGIYFYVIKIGNTSWATGKLVIVK